MPKKIYLFLVAAFAFLILLLLREKPGKPINKRLRPLENLTNELLQDLLNSNDTSQPKCNNESLLLLISSSVRNIDKRQALRRAYSTEDLERLGVRRIFVVGTSRIPQDLIAEESIVFQDILQADFLDTYRNLTLKHLLSLGYASKCKNIKLIAKMDDDIVLDLFSLIKMLKNKEFSSEKIYGYKMHSQHPERSPENKWFVSNQEYPGNFYPDFVSGWFYLTSMDVVNKLLEQAKIAKNYLWIDDVFVTGILRERAMVQIEDLKDLYATDYRYLECCLRGRRRRFKCDFLVGPDGGKIELQIEFKKFAEFCDEHCSKRDKKNSIEKTCVAVFKENWKPVGNGVIEPVTV